MGPRVRGHELIDEGLVIIDCDQVVALQLSKRPVEADHVLDSASVTRGGTVDEECAVQRSGLPSKTLARARWRLPLELPRGVTC